MPSPHCSPGWSAWPPDGGPGETSGQTTAEYALVLVGVAAIALLLAAWAARTNRIGRLFDAVLDSILDDVT